MIVPGHPRISIDPAIRFGKPAIAGTRMGVTDVLELLANGASHEEIAEDYAHVTAADVRACLLYAAAELKHPIVLAAE